MTATISSSQFTNGLFSVLTETFESVQGFYLDRGTSLFETLAGITAAEASIPVGNQCATIAAQVTHVCFFLDVLDHFMKTGQNEPADWGEVWRTVREISPEAWVELQNRLWQAYTRLQASIRAFEHWEMENAIGGAIGVVTHTAYHLGEIRQALCTVKK